VRSPTLSIAPPLQFCLCYEGGPWRSRSSFSSATGTARLLSEVNARDQQYRHLTLAIAAAIESASRLDLSRPDRPAISFRDTWIEQCGDLAIAIAGVSVPHY